MSGSGDSRLPPFPAALLVAADIDIEVDGISARLEGDGGRLVLRSDRPHLLVSSLTRASLPAWARGIGGLRSVGRAAQAMSDAGVHLEVEGPRGAVVSLGHGERSIIGRIVTGSRSVAPGSVRSLLPFLGVAMGRVRRTAT